MNVLELTRIEAMLKPFCGDDEGRFPLAKPWVKGGWLIASDGRIAVRVPAPETPDTEIEAPNQEALSWSAEDEGPWPPFECVAKMPEKPLLCDCVRACSKCDGRGYVICEGWTCPECGGAKPAGREGCPKCGGTGKIHQVSRLTRIGVDLVAEKYWKLIASLPGVRLAKRASPPGKGHFPGKGGPPEVWGNRFPVPFLFDGGGQGLVMPVIRL